MAEVVNQGEHYLPLGYDYNKIVLLARDPNWLYAYWELSNERYNEFVKEFGQELWNKSTSAVKVTNVSKNESFFVQINDFCSSCYINVPDACSLYVAEIGRKIGDSFFISLISSNYTVTPTNSVSKNGSAYFIDYNSLKDGRFDLETGVIYETFSSKSYFDFIAGISSSELLGLDFNETYTGISSAEFFGMNIDYPGISSEAFIR